MPRTAGARARRCFPEPPFLGAKSCGIPDALINLPKSRSPAQRARSISVRYRPHRAAASRDSSACLPRDSGSPSSRLRDKVPRGGCILGKARDGAPRAVEGIVAEGSRANVRTSAACASLQEGGTESGPPRHDADSIHRAPSKRSNRSRRGRSTSDPLYPPVVPAGPRFLDLGSIRVAPSDFDLRRPPLEPACEGLSR